MRQVVHMRDAPMAFMGMPHRQHRIVEGVPRGAGMKFAASMVASAFGAVYCIRLPGILNCLLLLRR